MAKTNTTKVSDPICDREEKFNQNDADKLLKEFDDSKKVTDMSGEEGE